MSVDWTDPAARPMNEHGSKAQISNYRTDSYSAWRRTVGNGCYASDLDWIEWRSLGGVLIPVAVIETTYYDDIVAWRPKLPLYRAAALERFKRDGQHHFATYVAAKLNVAAYFVLVRKDLGWFMVCALRTDEWADFDEVGYRRWIEGLYLAWVLEPK